MSGGQQAQLALTLALARRPRLLVLDEPMAMLDPLARNDYGLPTISCSSREAASKWWARSMISSPATACSPAQPDDGSRDREESGIEIQVTPPQCTQLAPPSACDGSKPEKAPEVWVAACRSFEECYDLLWSGKVQLVVPDFWRTGVGGWVGTVLEKWCPRKDSNLRHAV